MAHTFDTSGEVRTRWDMAVQWRQLSPGLQGMIGAMMEDVAEFATHITPEEPLGFRHIAPATLARLMKDWETALYSPGHYFGDNEEHGRMVWISRQAGHERDIGLNPLVLSIQDGLVHVADAGEAAPL